MRSIEKDLLFLNEARNLLRKMPTIDPAVPTILIAGYPNVGKSSFIVRVTGARPEIAMYPFTTRGIFVGHFMRGDQKYQVVDTPGLLDRPMEERNEIERQTVAALSHLQGVVLFILDPSEHCGYLIDSQLSLAEDLKNWLTLPVLVVANKADILRFGEDKDMLNMSTETGEGVNEVLDKLVCLLDAMPRYVAPDPDQKKNLWFPAGERKAARKSIPRRPPPLPLARQPSPFSCTSASPVRLDMSSSALPPGRRCPARSSINRSTVCRPLSPPSRA